FQWTLAFKVGEHLSGADHDLARQAGELGDMDAVAAIGAALDHLVEKDDALALFADLHPKIPQPRKLLGQRRQLVIMGGEERQRAKLRCIVEILEDRRCDAPAAGGAGRAPTRVKLRSPRPMPARPAGTKLPTWASMTMMPACRK